MARDHCKESLIISTKISGETNKTICYLSRDEGICYATLYGGPKSRLRSLISPGNRGLLYLYKNQTKKTAKINDFDVKKYHPLCRENLFKTWAAAFVCELAVKTNCAGSPLETWKILNGFLDGMELTTENQSKTGLLRYIWRYLKLLGIQPDTTTCVRCGYKFFTGNFQTDILVYNKQQEIIYSIIDNGFVCTDCIENNYDKASLESRGFLPLDISALFYLKTVAEYEPKISRTLPLDKKNYYDLKRILFFLVENSAGCRLNTIKTGTGIL